MSLTIDQIEQKLKRFETELKFLKGQLQKRDGQIERLLMIFKAIIGVRKEKT